MQNGIMYIKRAFFFYGEVDQQVREHFFNGEVDQQVEGLCSCTASQNPTSSVCHLTSASRSKPGTSLEDEEQPPSRKEEITRIFCLHQHCPRIR